MSVPPRRKQTRACVACRERKQKVIASSLTQAPNLSVDQNNTRLTSSVDFLEAMTDQTQCDSGRPCARCFENSIECIVDESNDLRRKGALKRKAAMMEQDQEHLIQLVSALRGSNERHVSHLVNMIRSHASLQEIRDYITDHLKLGTIEDTSEVTEFRRQIGFLLDVEGPAFESRKAQRIAHPRSLNVPAKPWTVIQCNNAFVCVCFGAHFAVVYLESFRVSMY